MKIYPEAFGVMKDINKVLQENKFEGRIADNGASLVFLMSMVACAGDGDHVEIGALFGGSAIAAALVKKKLGLSGDVYAIDPYDDEKRSRDIIVNPNVADQVPEEELCGSAEALQKNAKLFDVEIKLIEKSSDPWPEELKDHVFVSAYIDGNHLEDMPYTDFTNLKGRVSDYIGFDNYEEGYPDVLGAVGKVLFEEEDWVLFYKNGVFAALRRRLPHRATPGHVMTAV